MSEFSRDVHKLVLIIRATGREAGLKKRVKSSVRVRYCLDRKRWRATMMVKNSDVR